MVSEEGSRRGREDPRASWEEFIKQVIDSIGFVSSHYNYTEEYVLEHSPDWINRKHRQAVKEKWQESQSRIHEGTQSLVLLLDMAFNKGRNIHQIIPESFEEALRMNQENEQKGSSNFISGTWWKS